MRHKIISQDLKSITAADLDWDRFSGKTILITGANGFLPAYMVETLLYLNETRFRSRVRVIALARSRERAAQRFAHYGGREDLIILEHDLADPISIDGTVEYIVHAASKASPKFYRTDPVGTLLPNVLGTYHVLELARSERTQGLLFFSSGDVYGAVTEDRIPTKETDYAALDPLNPRACYGEAKRMGEAMCLAWHRQYGIPVHIVRIAHTYGPGMKLDDGRIFADIVSDVVEGHDISLTSDGSASRAFCYLADATIGFFTIILKGTPGEAYNLCHEEEETSVRDLAEQVAALYPEKGIRVQVRGLPSDSSYLPSPSNRGSLDSSKLRKLGWRPAVPIAEGFRRTIESYR